MTRNIGVNIRRDKVETILTCSNLAEAIQKHDGGGVIMLELPTETYFELSTASVKFLTDNGFEGIYISFQRPFKNISSFFKHQEIDMNKLLIIDGATAYCGEVQDRNPRCVQISPAIDIDGLVQTICTSLSKLKSKERFVFIDSLTTMALYEPFSEMARFSEFLISALRKRDIKNVTFLFNVSEDLSQKRFIKNMARYVDESIHVGLCT